MLDVFRERLQGPVAKGILGAVFLSFVFTGVGLEYFARNTDPFVAKVNGEAITKAEFEQALERQKRQYGESYKMLAATEQGKAMLRNSLIEQLINERLLDQMLADTQFVFSLEQVQQELVQIPQLQENGKFSSEKFKQILRDNNLTPKDYFDSQQKFRARQQMMTALQASAFTLDSELNEFYQLDRQTRDFRYIQLPVVSFGKVAEPSDDALKAYFEQHKAEFVVPEKVQLDYLILSKAALSQQSELGAEDIQNYYDEHKAEFKTAEKLKPAHILIAKGEDEKAAQAKAESLLAELKAGADFKALAAANSADDSSAKQGGELAWVERGAKVEKSILGEEFEAAVQNLKQIGDLSPVVKTKYGFHLIKLAEIEAPKQLELTAVSDLIKSELQRQRAENRFFELQNKLKELSFQFPDSLDEVAAQTGLKVQSTDWVSRNGGPGIAANPSVISAAFSEAVLLDKQNSEVIELDKDNLLVIRLKQHQPGRSQELAEVKADLVAKVKDEQARAQVKAEGERLLALAKDGKLSDDELKKLSLSWQSITGLTRSATNDLDPQIRNQAFRLAKPVDDKPSAEGLVLANGDYVLLQLNKVELAKLEQMTADDKKQQRRILESNQLNQELMALVASKRKLATIEMAALDEEAN